MKIYDEAGALLTGDPDLTAGYLTHEQRLAAHHKVVKEKSHLEVMVGTDGLRRKVVIRPRGQPGMSMRPWGCITFILRRSWRLKMPPRWPNG